MPRPPVTEAVPCSIEGCTERPAYFEYPNQRERAEAFRRRLKDPYKCSRHLRPEWVLSVETPERVTVMVAVRSAMRPDQPDLYWDGRSASEWGKDFKAFARDFPEGTKLTITARIELPDDHCAVGKERSDP